ncbi:MAG TPA: radical SAM family heme chaperone HemW [Longimicrobiaceae bacterium]
MVPRSLYVHVPFCVRRCSYCDFAVHATPRPPVDDWLDAVTAELDLQIAHYGWRAPLFLDTLYIGGGTPSLLGPRGMLRLRERLERVAEWDPEGVEWTAEANPESFTPDVAQGWREAGVNRLSLGVQTFHEPTLRWMGRMHGPEGPVRAMEAARAAGFRNVSLDLIFGLPERLGRSWEGDVEGVLALEPEHISLYGLTAEAATPLGRWVREGREVLADEDRYAREYLHAHARLTQAGFEHYEVSNFGREGHRSRHNFIYWTGAPYAALGPGAHGFRPPVRSWNLRDWEAYRHAIGRGALPLEGEEVVGDEDARLEQVWLGLRTVEGIPTKDINEVQRDLVGLWAQQGWAREESGRVRLTAEGWLLLDRLAVDFAAAGEVS